MESPMNHVHHLIHEAAYQLSLGNLAECNKILTEADQFTHDHCGRDDNQLQHSLV